jgi:hypothetical protein
MVLFKLEISIPGPILGFWGKINPLEIFGSVGGPNTPLGVLARDHVV